MTTTQINILSLLFSNGALSDERLRHAAKMRGVYTSPSGIRTRRNELVKQGLVHCAGTKTSDHGRRTQLWDLTPAGIEAVIGGRVPLVSF